VDFNAGIVVEEAQLSKFFIKKLPRDRVCPDQLRQPLQADFCDDRLGGSFLAKIPLPKFANTSRRRASRFALELKS
jgi:hypothetical protein